MTRPRLVHGKVVRFRPGANRGRRPWVGPAAILRPTFRVLSRRGVAIVFGAGFGAALAVAWLNVGPTAAGPTPTSLGTISRSQITVVDGDTIRVDGRLTRLVGFNAPETWRPACASEMRLGEQATARVRQMWRTSALEFAEVPCACPSGAAGTSDCNYGRACGTLRADGRDVGDILIAEGLAVPFVCRGTGCPPTPRPWCAG